MVRPFATAGCYIITPIVATFVCCAVQKVYVTKAS